MKKNAIILAAGKSNRFAPFTYERPKGLFRVKNEILIERQIRQLNDAGVNDIYVVVGYMKEKFFYLEKKYGVKLLINNTFSKYGNIYSLYVARKYLSNTFICCADQYFVNNPFIDNNDENISYRATNYIKRKFREFSIDYSDADIITGCYIGGENRMAMVGHAYFNEKFSKSFRKMLENEINDFGISNMFWEEFYAKHQKDLTLYMKKYEEGEILEFDSIDDLRLFDSEFLINVDSKIVLNICNTLKCKPNDIKNIKIIQAGLTNVSFKFTIENTQYVYRHPGGTAGNLINRTAEIYAQNVAKKLKIDNSIIYMDPTGWKISYYIDNTIPISFKQNEIQLKMAIDYLKKIHNYSIQNANIKNFDCVAEGKKLMSIAATAKGNLFEEFADMIEKVEKIQRYAENEAKENNMHKTLCHDDIYEPNFLLTNKNELYLIDWEYAGINDPVCDLANIITRDKYSDEEIDKIFKMYFGNDITKIQYRHAYAYLPINSFYWFSWGLYKGSVGEEDGFFFLPAYRNFYRFIEKALKMYEEHNQ